MPRGGSKRGERRGNAKGHAGRPAGPNFTEASGVTGAKSFEPIGQDGPGRPKGGGRDRKRAPMKAMAIEREDKMRALLGSVDLLPKDVMLSAMRYFSDVANQYRDVMNANLTQAAVQAANREAAVVYENAAAQAEHRFLTYLRDACDVAYKVAPFCHARLMGVINDPGANMAGTGFDMLRGILNEIAEHSRGSMLIEHQAEEQTMAEADR